MGIRLRLDTRFADSVSARKSAREQINECYGSIQDSSIIEEKRLQREKEFAGRFDERNTPVGEVAF